MIKVTIPNLAKVKNAFSKYPALTAKEVQTALLKSITEIQRDSRMVTPVDTGRLRTSIGQAGGEGIFEVKKMSAEVGTNIKYAVYVHEGTKYMPARPFLQQGVDRAMSKIKEYFKDAVENVHLSISKASK